MNKKVVILGGGTMSHVRTHFSLCAPAYGKTARALYEKCNTKFPEMDVELVLTKMADYQSEIETNEDVSKYIDELVADNTVKIVFFNVALCDFEGEVLGGPSGKYETRLESHKYTDKYGDNYGCYKMWLKTSEKIINKIRKTRKDIFLIGFKATCNATEEEQFNKGLNLLKNSSANIVLANDVATKSNFIVTPEDGVYGKGMSRDEVLDELVDMAWHRSHLSFTRTQVVDGQAVAWSDERVPSALRTVIDYCISKNAYKEFKGATTGHFAAKLGNNEFLTSIRKTNFNDIDKHGMVLVKTEGDDNIIAYGVRPSVGGQSQRIIFERYSETDSIVHFHSPLKEGHLDNIPVVSQREYECGSHQCGENTANGLGVFGNLFCVMLDNHGPNIVFNSSIDPQEVIDFIDNNFDLEGSTSGFKKVNVNYKQKVLA
jgi:hypothetical protein